MKPLSISVKTIWAGLLGLMLCVPLSNVQASNIGLLPGAQQQRGIDNDIRRQQKQLQLDALEEQKKRQQEAEAEHSKPLVVVPEDMKAPTEGQSDSDANKASTIPADSAQPMKTEER